MSQEMLTQNEIKRTMQHADMLLRIGQNKESLIPNASLFDDESGIHYNIRRRATNANRFSKSLGVALSSVESGDKVDMLFSRGPFWLKDSGMLNPADRVELIARNASGPVEVGRYALIAVQYSQFLLQAKMQNETILDDETVVAHPSLNLDLASIPEFLPNESVLPILAGIRNLSPDNLVDR